MNVVRNVIAGCIAAALAGCGNSQPASVPAQVGGKGHYDALVRRTAMGVPHIKANDYASLGYGLGYAQAEDNLCVILQDILTDRGERSKYFGPDGTYTIVPNGNTSKNLDSDFFWKFVVTQKAIDHLRDVSLPEARAASTGFKDGFNRYVREIRAGRHAGRHAQCRGADWLVDLTDDDMYRRYIRLGVIASSSVFVTEVATAQPPAGAPAPEAAPTLEALEQGMLQSPALAFFRGDKPFGSNMYALGPQATSNGVPIVWGNPHFPWSGTERLYAFHATLPGSLDIMGSALYGVPAVLIGFNDHFAWSHTVSTAYRFTFYELTLAPNDPTSYVYDGQILKMEATPVTVDVKQADGTIAQQTRTLYRSKYGPMMSLKVSGQNIFPWSNAKAYTLRDANFENDRLINQFFLWNKAKSLDEFIALHKSVLGIPWVNTVASGPGGKAYYGDVSVVPNVPDAKAQACGTSAQAQALAQVMPGLYVLDGSRADCEWGTDPDAPAPGIFGPGNLPTLVRDDWVHNCNDSYWLTNPAEPLPRHARIIGDVQTARSLRTRLCIQQVLRHLDQPGNDHLGVTFDDDGDRKFDQHELEETGLSAQIYSAELARDDVVGNVCAAGTVATLPSPSHQSAGAVDVSGACTALAQWNLTDNLDSRGGHVWREFITKALPNPAGVGPNPALWLTPFDSSDPVNTPRGINAASPLVQDALGRAVEQIDAAGVAYDARMGELQRSGVIGDKVVPIFGGTHTEGAFTVVSVNPLDKDGYRVTYGNSYIQAVTWQRDGSGWTPVADAFVTYSESTDPASPHFYDYTQAYSQKQWQRLPFKESDVAAQTQESVHLSE